MARRILFATAALLLLLAVGVAVGLHFAAEALRDQVREALGAESEIADIHLGWSAVEVRGVRVPAPKDWPTADALRAERIVVTPDLGALFSHRQIKIARIEVDRAYLSIFRTHDGRLRLLPDMLEGKPKTKEKNAESGIPVSIDTVAISNAAVEIYDASVAKPAHKVRLEGMQAHLGPLHLPDLSSRTHLELLGIAKGLRHDGKFSLEGWIELASKDSEIITRLHGVDLLALQPYLIKASETGVRQGSLDLDLKSIVRRNRLHAPGNLTLNQLELAAGKSGMATFMGMPRTAVVGLLKDRNGRISIQFTLEGQLDDPRFSLNEAFMKKIGAAMAEGLGISLESVAREVGSATQSIGSSLGKLFGK